MTRYLRSNAIALAALFVALGGTSYAAMTLPAGSVGTKQLRNGAVTAAKVKKGSLLAKDFKSGQLPAGRQGPKGDLGAPGNPGAPGTARAYALVNSDGTFISGVPHPGFTAVSKLTGFPEFFCLTPAAGITPAQYPGVVSADIAHSPAGDAAIALYRDNSDGGASCGAGEYEVLTESLATAPPTTAPEAFSIIVP
jgi:hypothetical protein